MILEASNCVSSMEILRCFNTNLCKWNEFYKIINLRVRTFTQDGDEIRTTDSKQFSFTQSTWALLCLIEAWLVDFKYLRVWNSNRNLAFSKIHSWQLNRMPSPQVWEMVGFLFLKTLDAWHPDKAAFSKKWEKKSKDWRCIFPHTDAAPKNSTFTFLFFSSQITPFLHLLPF